MSDETTNGDDRTPIDPLLAEPAGAPSGPGHDAPPFDDGPGDVGGGFDDGSGDVGGGFDDGPGDVGGGFDDGSGDVGGGFDDGSGDVGGGFDDGSGDVGGGFDDGSGDVGWDPDAPMPSGPPPEPWEIPPYDPIGDPRVATEDQILRQNEDWVRLPRPWGMLRRILLVVSVILVILGGTAWYVNDWLQRQLDPPGDPGEIVSIEVPDGASTNDIARILANEGVVPNATVARYYFRYKNAGPFLAGEYAMARNSAVWEVREVLEAGPIPTTFETITIPEGLWLSQITPRLLDQLPAFDPAELAQAMESGVVTSRFQPSEITTLEGLLFPDTYAVDEDSAANELDLIRRMVQQMDTVLTELGYESAEELTGYSAYEVITIASLIEEEAFVAEDRAKISRVIYNRLEEGMPLQIDATVLYAIGEQKEELTVTDLAIDSPYNTRINDGLPPTPIAAPGRAALEAALAPEPGPWIYYVLADEDGSHYFTDDFDDFNRQVAESRAAGLF